MTSGITSNANTMSLDKQQFSAVVHLIGMRSGSSVQWAARE